MSQHDFDIANQGFPATRADLNNALKAAVSNSAGTSAPSTTYAYQFWYDSTNNIIKMRNGDNDAWISVATVDQTNDLVSITHTGMLDLVDDDGSASIRFQAPSTVTSTTTFTLPDGDGDSGQTLITNGSGTLSWHAPYGNRNLVINGAMQVAQRGTSAVTINSGSATYRLDRFYASGASSAGVYTVEQSTDAPANFKNSLKVTVTTADSSIGSTTNYRVQQSLEGQNISHLNYGSSDAQTVTLSFYVKSSLTGTFGGKLGNSARDRSYPFTYTISSANTWERKTVTIAGDTSGTWLDTNGTGIELAWSMGAGSSRLGTAGAWAGTRYDGASGQTNIIATNSATWLITGIQLEVGSVATPFEHEPYGVTLQKAQRYCQVRSSEGVNFGVFAGGGLVDNNVAYFTIPHITTMRAAPSNSITGNFRVDGGNNIHTSFTFEKQTTHSFRAIVATSSITTSVGQLHSDGTNTSTIISDAEL